MRCRVIGTYTYKGSAGVYLEALDVPGPARYTACDYALLPMDEMTTEAIQATIWDLPLTADDLTDRLDKTLG
jgi:hypothetical protein